MFDWVEIFRAGTHIDSAGNERAWTEADLNKIASSYDPAGHEAPVVVGHPKENAPAFGWVEAVKSEGGKLYAKFKSLVPEFVDAVKQGLYKKRSISLYPDLTLRHVGFLGAMPPAVKGLADIKFSGEELTTIEYQEGGGTMDEMIKKMSEMIGKVHDMMTEMLSGKKKQTNMSEEELQKKELEFAEMKTRFEELQKKEKEAQETAKKVKVTSFCEGLRKEGRLPKAWEDGGILEFMNALTPAVIEFSDKKVGQLEWFQDFLRELPKSINLSEIAKKEKDTLTESKRETVIADYMEKNKGVSYSQAAVAVSKTNPELYPELEKTI